jgi:hypothetical protein
MHFTPETMQQHQLTIHDTALAQEQPEQAALSLPPDGRPATGGANTRAMSNSDGRGSLKVAGVGLVTAQRAAWGAGTTDYAPQTLPHDWCCSRAMHTSTTGPI